MEKLFLNNIEKNFSSLLNNKFIVAVSGGVDSIVLLHLCRNLKLNFVVAHCNFKLRGKESDDDELFVKNLAAKYKISFYSNSFNTKELSNSSNKSVQMIARDLRYSWFNKLSEELGIDYIITAHHIDDSIETFLINLSRGAGINGFLGIPEVNNKINRPLLAFTKDQLKSYALENKILFREDSSNKKKDYLRNQIRLEVIPKLKKINPYLLESFPKTIKKLEQSKSIIADRIAKVLSEVSFKKGGELFFEIESIKNLSNIEAYVYEIFKQYNFTQWDDIVDLLDSQTGKEVVSKTHRLLKNREYLILTKKVGLQEISTLINSSKEEIKISAGTIIFSKADKIDKKNPYSIFLDSKKLKFPLKVRNVVSGDYFYPFGMDGKKKVSKYLKDQKISKYDKEKTLILETSKNEIVWLIGMRLDHRFSVTDKTKEILKIQLIP